jgi:hypothetical protein
MGRHLEHGSQKIPGQLHTLCRAVRWHAGHLPSGVGAMQKVMARQQKKRFYRSESRFLQMQNGDKP